MKRKSLFSFISLILFSTCFVASVKVFDHFKEQNLRKNLREIKLGMTEQQVLQILGKPTNVFSSDSPSSDWCYETDSISRIFEDQPEIHCGKILVETSSSGKDGRVVKIFDF